MLPRVSVGLPVFNGERYLERTLGDLLGGTFEDFELVAVDNASTDATADILADAARRDRRVRVIAQRSQHRGAAERQPRRLPGARAALRPRRLRRPPRADFPRAPRRRAGPCPRGRPRLRRLDAHRRGRPSVRLRRGPPPLPRCRRARHTTTTRPSSATCQPERVAARHSRATTPCCTAPTSTRPSTASFAAPCSTASDRTGSTGRTARSSPMPRFSGPFSFVPEALFGYRIHAASTFHLTRAEWLAREAGKAVVGSALDGARTLFAYLGATAQADLRPLAQAGAAAASLGSAVRPAVLKRIALPGPDNYFGWTAWPGHTPDARPQAHPLPAGSGGMELVRQCRTSQESLDVRVAGAKHASVSMSVLGNTTPIPVPPDFPSHGKETRTR